MFLRIKAVAHKDAPSKLYEKGYKKLSELFQDVTFEADSRDPNVVYFLTGGSERSAIPLFHPDHMTLLLADFPDNAFAAAMEVKAWADRQGLPVMLVSMDEALRNGILGDYEKVCETYRKLDGKRAGLVGNVSHWLVASEFPLKLARQRFGIDIVQILWDDLPDYTSFGADATFLDAFKEHNPDHLVAEAGIYSFLQHVAGAYRLDAITLECFELVNERAVTACLALGLMNSRGQVAGCEGDLVSLVGMMLVQALTGEIPWMANVAGFKGDKLIFAHCTVPLNLVKGYRLNTHFETGKSAAIQGKVSMEEVTVFRLGQDLDKAFVGRGQITGRPSHGFACRTQTEVRMAASDMDTLLTRPLGNHHLIIPGNWVDLIRLACRYKGLAVL